MKLLYIHQYFITPEESGGARSYYIAKQLLQAGHEVIMITSNTKHRDWSFVELREVEGIKVIYIKNFYDSSMSKLSRIVSFLKFMLLSTFFVHSTNRS